RGPLAFVSPPPHFRFGLRGFPSRRNFRRGPTRLRRSWQFEFVQSRDHFVPVGSPPVHAATGGTTPEYPMWGAVPFRHRVLHILPGRTHEDLVAHRATGERTDESGRA